MYRSQQQTARQSRRQVDPQIRGRSLNRVDFASPRIRPVNAGGLGAIVVEALLQCVTQEENPCT